MNKQNYSAIEELIIGTPIEQNINELGQKSAARKIALETFEKAKNSYMHVAVKKLEKILKIENHGE